MLALGQEALQKITEQVELYPREIVDGMVSLALICFSSDMKGHLGLGEEDVSDDTLEAVAQALRTKSTTLKVSEDGKKVRRTTVFVVFKLLTGSSDRTQAAEHSSEQITQESVESEPKQTAEEKALLRERHLLFQCFGTVKVTWTLLYSVARALSRLPSLYQSPEREDAAP